MHRLRLYPGQNIVISKSYDYGAKAIKRFLLGMVLDYNVNRRAWFIECANGLNGWVPYDASYIYKPT